ncbi:MAG: lysylphosphatidylglycerol synthase domain-containing protein [Woeseiaceae bacterium]|nr:lysylphosphatidylglycerol synthase domain-containing protein [Woeseiaceae bacterium]
MTLKVFRLIAVGFLLAAVVYFLGANASELSVLAELQLSTLLLVALIILVATVLYAHSMYVYLEELLPSKMSGLQWQSLVFASRLLNYTLPQGANIYRGGFLKTRYDLPVATYVGVVLFHSWIFATLTFWAAVLLSAIIGAEQKILIACVLLAVGATLVAPLLAIRFPVNAEHPVVSWVVSRLRALSETLARLGRHWAASLKLALIVIVTFLLTVASVYLLLAELNRAADIEAAVFLSIIFTLNRFVNVVPANLGLTELLTGAAYEFLGGSLVAGILISGVLRVLEFIVAIVLGGAAIFFSDHRLNVADEKGTTGR